jgi:hypothetical protein
MKDNGNEASAPWERGGGCDGEWGWGLVRGVGGVSFWLVVGNGVPILGDRGARSGAESECMFEPTGR